MNADPHQDLLVTHAPDGAVSHVVPQATRNQRVALLAGVLVVIFVALHLFASILLPFVAAAGIAYILDPFCTRMVRNRVPRGVAAMVLVVGLILVALLIVLLLYPLVLSQVGILVNRIPAYVHGVSAFAAKSIAQLQQRVGPGVINEKLSDLVSSQAGAVLGFVTGAVTHIVGGGFAIFNVFSVAIVTPVVAFYFLRDWPKVTGRLDGWMPRRIRTRCARRPAKWTAFCPRGCGGRQPAASFWRRIMRLGCRSSGLIWGSWLG
jgi:predicted PurR-regulated permease PerM